MMKLIKSFSYKSIQYNLMSLINVFLGFVFIILLGRKFGAGFETDTYFLSLTIISYLSAFVRSIWSAIKQYYIELKIKNKILSDRVYSTLFLNIIVFSLIIIGLYYIIVNSFDIISLENKKFLDVFIFYLLLQNVILFNKIILNLEHYYSSAYFVDFIVYVGNIIMVVFIIHDDIIILAYSTVILSTVALFSQLYLIYFKLKVNIKFSNFFGEDLNKIYKNSFKINVGGLLYNSKELLIASVLLNNGTGIYSLFSYANKFVSVILQIVNAPIINIFITNISYIIANRSFKKIQSSVNEVAYKTLVYYISSSIIVYFLLPNILYLFFLGKFSWEEIIEIQKIFIYISVYFLIITIELPYLTVLNLFKKFNLILLINLLFFIMIGFQYMAHKINNFSFSSLFTYLILTQFIITTLYIFNYKLKLKNLRLY